MILSLIIIFLLLTALGRGWHRGFVVEFMHTVGYLVVLILVKIITPNVAPMIGRFLPANHQTSANTDLLANQVNHFWVSGITFWVLMIVGIILLHWFTRSLNLFTKLPVVHGVNALAGAGIAGLVMYVLIFFALAVAAVWPAPWLHEQVLHSPVSQWILHQTPLLSEQIFQWWLTR